MTTTPLLAASAAPSDRRPLGALLLAAGGAAWLAKLAVIVATGGEVTSTGAAAVFFVLGAVALVAGGAGIGWRLSAGRHAALRVGSTALAAVCVLAAFSVLDSAVPRVGPEWFEPETGILATALVALAVAALTLRSEGRRS